MRPLCTPAALRLPSWARSVPGERDNSSSRRAGGIAVQPLPVRQTGRGGGCTTVATVAALPPLKPRRWTACVAALQACEAII